MGLAQQAAESTMQRAMVATYGGGSTAIVAGISTGEWQIIGVIGGLLIGLAGLGVTVVFKVLEYRLAKAGRGK